MKMIKKQNPLTGDWLCQIDSIPAQAYFISGEKRAQKFCDKINADIINGKLTYKILTENRKEQ